MPSTTLLQDIKNDLDKIFKRIVRLRSIEFNPVMLHLSRAIQQFAKIRKRLKEKNSE